MTKYHNDQLHSLTMKKPPSYEEAYKELQQILEDLKTDKVTIDELEKKVQRAGKLAKFCSEKLRTTEQNLDKIIEDLGL